MTFSVVPMLGPSSNVSATSLPVRRAVHGAAAEPRRVRCLRADVAREHHGRQHEDRSEDERAARDGVRVGRNPAVVAAVPTTTMTTRTNRRTACDASPAIAHRTMSETTIVVVVAERTLGVGFGIRPRSTTMPTPSANRNARIAVAAMSSRWGRSQAAVMATAAPIGASARLRGQSERDQHRHHHCCPHDRELTASVRVRVLGDSEEEADERARNRRPCDRSPPVGAFPGGLGVSIGRHLGRWDGARKGRLDFENENRSHNGVRRPGIVLLRRGRASSRRAAGRPPAVRRPGSSRWSRQRTSGATSPVRSAARTVAVHLDHHRPGRRPAPVRVERARRRGDRGRADRDRERPRLRRLRRQAVVGHVEPGAGRAVGRHECWA